MRIIVVDIVVYLLWLHFCWCVDVIAASCYGACGCSMPDVYVLKGVCERTQPWGTPVLNWRCIDVCFLNVVYALGLLM